MARFEDWDPAGRAFDGVVAGQAWHWVDPVAGAAKAARALRPGGLLALFWNAFDPPPDLAEAIGAVYRRVLPDVPIFRGTLPGPEAYSTMLDGAAEGMGAAGGFGEPERRRFDWVRDYTRDEWLEQVPTFGGHSQLLADKLREVLEGIGAAIDAVGGAFTMRYAALLISANPDGEPLTVAPRGARGRSEPLPRPNAQVAGRP